MREPGVAAIEPLVSGTKSAATAISAGAGSAVIYPDVLPADKIDYSAATVSPIGRDPCA